MLQNKWWSGDLSCPHPCLQARVKPSCGRLVGFSSGPVNPHGVTAVTSGRRCALALWFTKEKLYRDMVSIMTTHSTDLLLRSDQPPGRSCGCLMSWHRCWITKPAGVQCKCGGCFHVLAYTMTGPDHTMSVSFRFIIYLHGKRRIIQYPYKFVHQRCLDFFGIFQSIQSFCRHHISEQKLLCTCL